MENEDVPLSSQEDNGSGVGSGSEAESSRPATVLTIGKTKVLGFNKYLVILCFQMAISLSVFVFAVLRLSLSTINSDEKTVLYSLITAVMSIWIPSPIELWNKNNKLASKRKAASRS